MTPKNASLSKHNTAADTTAAVDAFMSELAHSYKAEIEAVRRLILGAAPDITEGVKWKSPSFKTHEYFATINLREKVGVGVVLHLGAKARQLKPDSLKVVDSSGLLKWLAADRAIVRFASEAELNEKAPAFVGVIRVWVQHV